MNTNPQTLIVVMPVYNSQKTLPMAIESILSQSYRNLRLVIVDDNSSDQSLEIAKLYLKDNRVTVLHNKKNMGAYYSRNVGLHFFKNSVWGYFTTHDADDVSFEHRYLRIVRMLKLPRIVAVQDTFQRIDLRNGKELGAALTMAHAVFKRQVFASIGYFENVRFGADWEYWQRLNAFNKKNRYKTSAIKDVVGDSFVHENNLTIQIPLTSIHRKRYMSSTRKSVAIMSSIENWYRDFVNNQVTEVIS